jgi:hypothetical protein
VLVLRRSACTARLLAVVQVIVVLVLRRGACTARRASARRRYYASPVLRVSYSACLLAVVHLLVSLTSITRLLAAVEVIVVLVLRRSACTTRLLAVVLVLRVSRQPGDCT